MVALAFGHAKNLASHGQIDYCYVIDRKNQCISYRYSIASNAAGSATTEGRGLGGEAFWVGVAQFCEAIEQRG